jgi:hypothetical protein
MYKLFGKGINSNDSNFDFENRAVFDQELVDYPSDGSGIFNGLDAYIRPIGEGNALVVTGEYGSWLGCSGSSIINWEHNGIMQVPEEEPNMWRCEHCGRVHRVKDTLVCEACGASITEDSVFILNK